MNHRKSGRRLSRTSSHRTAMFRNMSASLIEHETIKTTLIKAKELRRVIEPLITLSKKDSVANRRLASARLSNKAAVSKLFNDLGKRFKARPGGYLRILKCGIRAGDKATMALVQLVEKKSEEELEKQVAALEEKVRNTKKVIDAEAVKDSSAKDAGAEKIESADKKAKPAKSSKTAEKVKAESATDVDIKESDAAKSPTNKKKVTAAPAKKVDKNKED